MSESTDPSTSTSTSTSTTPSPQAAPPSTSTPTPTPTTDRRSSQPSISRSSLTSSSGLPPPTDVSHRDGSPALSSTAPTGPTAFRSFWQAPASGGAGDGDPYAFSITGAIAAGTGPNYKIVKRNSVTQQSSTTAAAPPTAAGYSGAGGISSYGSTNNETSAEIAAIDVDVAAASNTMSSESAPLLVGGGGGGGGGSDQEEEERRKGCSSWIWVAIAAVLLSLLAYYFFHPAALVAGGGAIVTGGSIAAICNPFSIRPNPTIDLIHNHGILAHLHTLPNSDSNLARLSARHVSDYISPSTGSSSNSSFLFSSLDVPTRSFTSRFIDTKTHTVIEAEYFGLQFETVIQLSRERGDVLGDYQFALLSDDGAIVRVGEGKEGEKRKSKKEEEEEAIAAVEGDTENAGRLLINNDGVHATRLSVSSFLLPFHSYTQSYPLHISYFQGPPSHISLVLLWRNVTATNEKQVVEAERRGEVVVRMGPKEEREGVEGNEAWFEVKESEMGEESEATPLYEELLREGGWKVLREENYYLPRWFDWHAAFGVKVGVKFNPCV